MPTSTSLYFARALKLRAITLQDMHLTTHGAGIVGKRGGEARGRTDANVTL